MCSSDLSELTGYLDFTDFRKISAKHSTDNNQRNGVRKLLYLKNFSCGDHLRNASRIFSASSTLDEVILATKHKAVDSQNRIFRQKRTQDCYFRLMAQNYLRKIVFVTYIF